jgi:hypothetical protein
MLHQQAYQREKQQALSKSSRQQDKTSRQKQTVLYEQQHGARKSDTIAVSNKQSCGSSGFKIRKG